MFSDVETIADGERIEADICIVGSGPAGIAITAVLDGTGLKVVVLESGTFDFDFDTQDLYAGEIEDGLPPVPLDASRLRYFGGTSNHWGGTCGPFDAHDFLPRDGLAGTGWPITAGDLAAYYTRAHELIGFRRSDYDVEKWRRRDYGLIWKSGGVDLFDLGGTEVSHGLRQLRAERFGQSHRARLQRSQEMNVILGANLLGLQLNEARSRIEGLQVGALSGRRFDVKATKIVLATGGIENARLLLNDGFDRQLPATGRYFSFHPRLLTGLLALSKPLRGDRNPYDSHIADDQTIRFHLELSPAEQRRLEIANHAAVLQRSFLVRPDTEGYAAAKRLRDRWKGKDVDGGLIGDVATFVSDLDGALGQYQNRHNDGPIDLMSVLTYMDQLPNPESRISLDNATDALGMRRSRVEWRYFDHERDDVIRFNRALARAFGQAGVGRLRIDPLIGTPEGFEDLIRAESGGGHQIGTTRMSPDPRTGVVDRNCRVHGVENLFCAGSSVFTTGSWVNPTLTIVALSLRLADHLLGDGG